MRPIPEIIAEHSKQADVKIEAIIRDIGIDLDKEADLPDHISGQIAREPDGRYKISANAKEHYFRRRFTMAHELAHYVLHKDLLGAGTNDSVKYRTAPNGGVLYNSQLEQIHETQANAWAAKVLMPRRLVNELLKQNDGDAKAAALALKTSPQALEIRIKTMKAAGEFDAPEPFF